MRQRLTITLGALAATASLALATSGSAQIQAVVIVPAGLPAGHVEGKVADIEPSGDTTKTLRLEDGTRLTILASAHGPAVEPRPGDTVKANYLEQEGEKLVTSLRSDAEFQAP